MRLTQAIHFIDELTFGRATGLDGSRLEADVEGLRRHLRQDPRLESVDLELVRLGEPCRVGYVFDVIGPLAKEPSSEQDFPGILGPPSVAGYGTTHVMVRNGTLSARYRHMLITCMDSQHNA